MHVYHDQTVAGVECVAHTFLRGKNFDCEKSLIEEEITQWRKDPIHSAVQSSDCTSAICIAPGLRYSSVAKEHNTTQDTEKAMCTIS